MEVHWWKCQIVGKEGARVFQKGEIVFVRKRDRSILLFDGNKKKADLPRGAIRDLKIISRLDKKESHVVEASYSLAQNVKAENWGFSGELWRLNRR